MAARPIGRSAFSARPEPARSDKSGFANNDKFWTLFGAAASDEQIQSPTLGDGASDITVLDGSFFGVMIPAYGHDETENNAPPNNNVGPYKAVVDLNLDGVNLDEDLFGTQDSNLQTVTGAGANYGTEWTF